MAVTVVPVDSGQQSGGISLPDYCSFCISNSGGDVGQVLINGMGVTSASIVNAFDLKTMFTSAGFTFRSYPLLRAFRIVGTVADAHTQFVTHLDINSFLMGAVGATTGIGIDYLHGIGGGPSNVPYLGISVPDANAIWRVDLRLRHSIMN